MKENFIRIPNCECIVCKKKIYKRPHDIERGRMYCSKQCVGISQRRPQQKCEGCGKLFKPQSPRQRMCSRQCVWSMKKPRTNTEYSGDNKPQRRLAELKAKTGFTKCMVEGCEYNKTYDIHRIIPGRKGGEYVFGNMFAICPNHHAEVHRKICVLIKINNSQLKAIY